MSTPRHDRLAPLLPAGEPIEGLLRRAQFFTPGTPTQDFREVHRKGGRTAEEFYRERWRHDKEVRSTHGVNCTGSCSWLCGRHTEAVPVGLPRFDAGPTEGGSSPRPGGAPGSGGAQGAGS